MMERYTVTLYPQLVDMVTEEGAIELSKVIRRALLATLTIEQLDMLALALGRKQLKEHA